MCHVSRGIVGQHGDETVGAHHVIAIRLQVGGYPIDDFVPLGLGEVHIAVADSRMFLFDAVLIHAPVQGSFHAVVNTLNDWQIGQFGLRRITHFDIIVTCAQHGKGSQCDG